MERKQLRWFSICLLLFAMGCRQQAAAPETETLQAGTPVVVAPVTMISINDSIELNATSSFLQNNFVKASSTGYVRSVNTRPGEYVASGKLLFTIETKESSVIGHSITSLDSSFKFNGLINIKATGHGYLTQLNHQQGDYVQDGEQLAIISDMNSFVFLLNLPYELKPLVRNGQQVALLLPDGTRLRGIISSAMPTVDSLSQTQTLVIKVNSSAPIPQNLVAKVHIGRTNKANAQTIPKSAVLSDEAQTNFWVMKMINDSTAVKIEVKKGFEGKDRFEILEPIFSAKDRILVSGNYGLPDTAKVIIAQP
jgi:multidrug efflux pump subunit AcrA (membrane-fusion protein)